ncbi:hypothetical protein BDN70DRAFT_935991 [Pholiota conissans]|uniref:Uncharacterized protein n=1 Tax=Pholiota conissans TaxID=109636 RepID=A0A9P6CQ09_9AGAR|nr:hypothetical protein BDN70DRAFT_935991 [Pholiota conissans]
MVKIFEIFTPQQPSTLSSHREMFPSYSQDPSTSYGNLYSASTSSTNPSKDGFQVVEHCPSCQCQRRQEANTTFACPIPQKHASYFDPGVLLRGSQWDYPPLSSLDQPNFSVGSSEILPENFLQPLSNNIGIGARIPLQPQPFPHVNSPSSSSRSSTSTSTSSWSCDSLSGVSSVSDESVFSRDEPFPQSPATIDAVPIPAFLENLERYNTYKDYCLNILSHEVIENMSIDDIDEFMKDHFPEIANKLGLFEQDFINARITDDFLSTFNGL